MTKILGHRFKHVHVNACTPSRAGLCGHAPQYVHVCTVVEVIARKGLSSTNLVGKRMKKNREKCGVSQWRQGRDDKHIKQKDGKILIEIVVFLLLFISKHFLKFFD